MIILNRKLKYHHDVAYVSAETTKSIIMIDIMAVFVLQTCNASSDNLIRLVLRRPKDALYVWTNLSPVQTWCQGPGTVPGH